MTLPLDFVAPRQLRAASVHGCLRPGDPDSGVSVINLRALAWTEPAGLVAIATFIESQFSIGRVPRLETPRLVDLGNYLRRMRVGAVVDEYGGWHDLPAVTNWDQSGRLIELRRFDDGAPAALGLLVQEQLGTQPAAIAFHNGICEIGANVSDHALADYGYIAAVTVRGSGIVSFAIGDAGVGLLEPLSEFDYDSEADVLQRLFTQGLSRYAAAGRGNGVLSTRVAVTDAGGDVYMASGRHALVASGPDAGLRSIGAHQALPGTLLQATMPLAD